MHVAWCSMCPGPSVSMWKSLNWVISFRSLENWNSLRYTHTHTRLGIKQKEGEIQIHNWKKKWILPLDRCYGYVTLSLFLRYNPLCSVYAAYLFLWSGRRFKVGVGATWLVFTGSGKTKTTDGLWSVFNLDFTSLIPSSLQECPWWTWHAKWPFGFGLG